jgi:hypothetical protein
MFKKYPAIDITITCNMIEQYTAIDLTILITIHREFQGNIYLF